ncbi:MAG: hypothetical protein AAF125_16430 [Chloroflexota bacterium]
MANKEDLEGEIIALAEALAYLQDHEVILNNSDQFDAFVDAGFGLLQHYQNVPDTEVNDNIVGLFVDAAMTMNMMIADEALPDDVRGRAESYMTTLEDLVTAITRAVEKNIASGR